MPKGKTKGSGKRPAKVKVTDLAGGRRADPKGGSGGDEAGALKGVVLSDANLSIRRK